MSKKILMIDDDPDFIDAVQTLLESKGYAVVTASDGQEGIAKAKKEKKWKPVAAAPRAELVQLSKIYANEPIVSKTLGLYELFRDVEKLEKVRENEFRKGVNLKVTFRGQVVNINLETLKE